MNENQETYFEDDGIFESINRFEDMLNRNSTCYFDVFEFENIIDYYIEQHNFNNARTAIEKGLRQHPCSNSLKLRLAQLYIQNGKPSKGLHFLREMESIEYANNDFYFLKGSALNVLGKKEEASAAFDRAIQLTYDGRDEIVFNIAYSYLNTRRYNLAVKYLMLAHDINPRNTLVLQELALLFERIDKLDKSIEYYQKYLSVDPYAENIWFNLGMVYSSLEEFDKAIEAYDFAIAICPDYISAYFSKANTMVNQGLYSDAIAIYKEIILFEPDNTQAYTYIGECYEKSENFELAIRYYQKSLASDNTFGDAWFGLGMAYFQLKEFVLSLQYFVHANSVDPENPDYWYMLGEVYKKLNLFDKSAEAYTRTVELDPNDYEAWLSFADICFIEDKVHDAIDVLTKACQYNHDNSTINYNLAAYYLYSDQHQLAYEYFEKGLVMNYNEHSELLLRYPKTSKNKIISGLITKYKKLKH